MIVNDNKVSAIGFVMSSFDYQSVVGDKDFLLSNLQEKYGKYYFENEDFKPFNKSDQILRCFVDEQNTTILLKGNFNKHGENNLMLMYSDVEVIAQMQQNAFDEL